MASIISCFSDESGPMCLLVKPLINKGLKNQFANIIEVFNVEAPTNYYFESLRWSPDGNSIVALDTENEIIIFSKNKIHEPIKLHLSSSYSPQFEGDEKVIYQLIGWNN